MLSYNLPSMFWGLDNQRRGDVESYSTTRSFVKENENEYILRFELPGVEQKDVDLEITNQKLTLRATREGEEDFKSSFQSVYRLPREFDREKVTAKLEKGILTVLIPKKDSEIPQKIKIDLIE